MFSRGVIRGREMARRIRDFSGLRIGKITPTDIDGFMEYRGKCFEFIEGKTGGASLPLGQRMAFERLVNAVSSPVALPAVLWVVNYEAGMQDIDYASCAVARYYFNGKWHTPREPINLKGAQDWFVKKYGASR